MDNKKNIESLKNILLKDPNDSQARLNLAQEFSKIGNVDEAIQELKELISRDENFLSAYQLYGRILSKLNQTQESKKIYRTAIDIATKQNNLLMKNELIEELEELEDEW